MLALSHARYRVGQELVPGDSMLAEEGCRHGDRVPAAREGAGAKHVVGEPQGNEGVVAILVEMELAWRNRRAIADDVIGKDQKGLGPLARMAAPLGEAPQIVAGRPVSPILLLPRACREAASRAVDDPTTLPGSRDGEVGALERPGGVEAPPRLVDGHIGNPLPTQEIGEGSFVMVVAIGHESIVELEVGGWKLRERF